MATSLLRWFVPQVALYGLIALATALLNTRRRFVAPMWVPIANNLVCIGVLLWFHHLVPDLHLAGRGPAAPPASWCCSAWAPPLGVAVQALLLLPSLGRARLSPAPLALGPAPRGGPHRAAPGSWTFGFVVANQVALFVVLALAVGAAGPAPVSSYTYAYTFMQMPYAVVAVSVMSAVTPDLAERWTAGDIGRSAAAWPAVSGPCWPSSCRPSVGMLLLAKPAVALLLGHGATTVRRHRDTGAALALFALGLPGFCTFLYVVRVLQSMQRTRVAFWLYLVENGINIVLALALVHPLGRPGPGPRRCRSPTRWPPLSAWCVLRQLAGHTRGAPDLGALAPGGAGHRGHGRGGAGGLQPVGGRPRGRPARPGRRRGGVGGGLGGYVAYRRRRWLARWPGGRVAGPRRETAVPAGRRTCGPRRPGRPRRIRAARWPVAAGGPAPG